MPVLAKKDGQWVTIANYTENIDSAKFKILTYVPTIDDLEVGEVGFYIDFDEKDELKLFVERTIIEAHIPDGTTSVKSYKFWSCYSLASVTIPESITTLIGYCFRECTLLETVIFKATPSSMYSNCFTRCTQDTLNIYVPWSEGEVSDAPWGATNATIHYNTDTSNMGSTTPHTNYPETYAAIIDGSITEINKNNFPQNVTSIGDCAIRNCSSLTSVTIPDSVISIGYEAFAFCTSLVSITIPDSVTSIGGSAFWSCSSLVSIIIPESVTSVNGDTFAFCTSLETVIFKGTPTFIYSSAFLTSQSTLNIYVPWSEGEVANAPWGATRATIHYNTDTSNM